MRQSINWRITCLKQALFLQSKNNWVSTGNMIRFAQQYSLLQVCISWLLTYLSSSSQGWLIRPDSIFRHLGLSLATIAASLHPFYPSSVLSVSALFLQVVLGQPHFRLPFGAHVSAILQSSFSGFLKVCPIHLHLLHLMVSSSCMVFALEYSSWLLSFIGQNMRRILQRHFLWKISNLTMSLVFNFHVSAP